MGRARGSPNANHEDKRLAMCRAMVPALLTKGRPATLKELAEAADVSVPTLRHYFGDRDEVVQAILEQAHEDAAPHLAFGDVERPVDEAVAAHLMSLVDGWRGSPLRSLVLGSITGGIDHPVLGPATVTHVLEPTTQSLEARLRHYQATGVLSAELDPRHGALALLGPVILALLHQDDLSGARCRPLDVAPFIEDLVAAFVRAHSDQPT